MSSRSRISRMHFLTAFCLKVLRGNARKRYCINIHGRKILHVVLYLQHNIRDILVNKCRVSQKILDWGFDKKNCRGPEGWGGHKCWVAYICLSFHIGRCYSGLYVTSRQLTMAQLDGWIRLLPHSGSILDSQLSWESGKFPLARWSHEVVIFSDRTGRPADHMDVRLARKLKFDGSLVLSMLCGVPTPCLFHQQSMCGVPPNRDIFFTHPKYGC